MSGTSADSTPIPGGGDAATQLSQSLLQLWQMDEAIIGPILELPKVLSELGVDYEELARAAGIDERLFDNPEQRISWDAISVLFTQGAALTQRADIGLLVGSRFSFDNFGDLGMLMRNSESVGEALRILVLHLHLNDRLAVPVMQEYRSGQVFFGYSPTLRVIPGITQLHDAALAVAFRILQQLGGKEFRPSQVYISHQPLHQRTYRQLFNTKVVFNAEMTGIVFSSRWLERPIPGADATQKLELIRRIENAEEQFKMSFVSQVRQVLQQALLAGSASSSNVAQLFAISERTLRKRLKHEGTSYQKLLNLTRQELAEHFLQNTSLPVAEIAQILCFRDSAIFSRAFRHWAGASPRQWRKQRSSA